MILRRGRLLYTRLGRPLGTFYLIFTDLPMIEPTPMPTAAFYSCRHFPNRSPGVSTVAPAPASVAEMGFPK
ncbi:MAG: hypothetical protein CM1200mP3_08440 [Chloroflexota bacterium]|nr:MAG: hypothetical protein CM1200mP3_08440 [Chloroflexota bacterium]